MDNAIRYTKPGGIGEQHNALLDIESVVGKGTTVRITFKQADC